MSPPTLTDLPHELLTKIIDPLDSESIYALSKTCKTLHFFALPLFLSRNGIHTYTELPDYVSISDSSQEGLSALRTSLFAGNLRSIKFYATVENVDRLFPDVRALQGLLARLPSIRTLTLVYLSHYDEAALRDAEPNMQEWSAEFSALLDAALQKSCQDLFISGGDDLFALSSVQPDSQDRCAPKSCMTVPGTACREALSKFQSEPPHPLTASRCSSFYIKSSMLLHPYLFRWTQSTLQANAGAMTHLSFNKVSTVVGSSTWHQLLPTLAFPLLYQFELTLRELLLKGTGVALRDIEAFLQNHPSIRILELSGIIVPNPTPRLRQPILPKLHTLKAHPKIIAWLLSHTVDHFRQLKSVTIASCPRESDYDQFDEALEAVALYSRIDALRLRLSFVSKVGLHEWMEKQVSSCMTPTGPIVGRIANFTRVTNLTIQTDYWMRLEDGDDPVVQLLPQFLALFLSLEKVDFEEQLSLGEFYLKGCKDFFKKVVSLCPRLQTLSIDDKVVDLASLTYLLPPHPESGV